MRRSSAFLPSIAAVAAVAASASGVAALLPNHHHLRVVGPSASSAPCFTNHFPAASRRRDRSSSRSRQMSADADAASSAGPTTTEPTTATFVLVHGAWHGGWCWRFVRQILEEHGHVVHTPTLTGLGERCHLLSSDLTLDTCCVDVANVLKYEDLTDFVLVGHSFGGSVISGVAELEPNRIRRLVYLDADVLEDGESPFSSLPAEEVDRRRKLAEATSPGGVSFPPPDAEALGVHDAEQRAFLERHLTPHPISTYESALRLKRPPGEGFPCTYVVCTEPEYATMNRARERAVRYGWEMRCISTGHDLMISAPEDTAQLLMDIVASRRDHP